MATRNRPPHAIEFIRPNYHYSISAVQCDTLRASLLGLAHHFAQARLGILKAPAVATSCLSRLWRFFHFRLNLYSGHRDYNLV